MLANSAKRYNFLSDLQKQKSSDESLLNSLVAILDSPIHTVRRLTAKCIFNIFPFPLVSDYFLNINYYHSENFLHGALLLFKVCYEYYSSNCLFDNKIKLLEEKFGVVMESRRHSYLTREVFDSTFKNRAVLAYFLPEAEMNSDALGISIWLKTCIKNFIHNGSWKKIHDHLSTLLESSDYECYCEYLFEKLENDKKIPADVLKKIAKKFILFQNKYNSSIIWKILYHISLKVELANVDVAELMIHLEGEITYKLRYIIPFVSRIISSTNVEEQQQILLQNIIFKLSDFENADFDMRLTAVLANNEIAYKFDNLSDEVKVISITTAVLLLQDEDENVRNICVNYYKNMKNLKNAVHPNICLNRLLDGEFLCETFKDTDMIKKLCQNILNCVSTKHNIDEDNPFANESKNIYLEVNVLKSLIENVKVE